MIDLGFVYTHLGWKSSQDGHNLPKERGKHRIFKMPILQVVIEYPNFLGGNQRRCSPKRETSIWSSSLLGEDFFREIMRVAESAKAIGARFASILSKK